MFMKISTIYLTTVILCSTLSYAAPLNSRAIQNFTVNCQLNQYASMEFHLAMTYLNASIYMNRDQVALPGFGRMFQKFWREQLENVNTIESYIVKRGGVVETPGVKLQFFNNLNSVDYFMNETMLVIKFLEEERQLNRRLLDLHKSTSVKNWIENECIKKFAGRRIREYQMTNELDPFTANFLDENFMSRKVEQIKFLADLLRKVNRFDQHPRYIEGITHNLNPLGIHILDGELYDKFSS